MKNPNYKGIELLPLSVIDAARAGDAEAVERVLRYCSRIERPQSIVRRTHQHGPG